jgi:hypothetical protein
MEQFSPLRKSLLRARPTKTAGLRGVGCWHNARLSEALSLRRTIAESMADFANWARPSDNAV